MPLFFALTYIILQFIPVLGKKIRPDINVRRIQGQNDLSYMERTIRGAEFVQIVSGDFSFIDTDPHLEACLRELAFQRKLVLISYKAQAIVVEEMSSKTSSHDILLKLQDEGNIYFDFPVKAKITLVERGKRRSMIYRFSKDFNGSDSSYMGFIQNTENTHALLAMVDEFVVALSKRPA